MLTLTPGQRLRHELTIKRSRFIATAQRTDDATQAREFIAAIRAEFPDARHNCSAFSVTPEPEVNPNPQLHSSDDGEPAGTAGKPMLDVLIGSGLTNVTVVVTRYFGGTLLGTGGLVRAYSQSVRDVLAGAQTVRREPARALHIEIPLAQAGKFEAELRTRNFTALAVQYAARTATFTALVPQAERHAFQQLVTQITKGSAQISDSGPAALEIGAGKLALATQHE